MDNAANPKMLNRVRLKKFITSNEILESAPRLRIVFDMINVKATQRINARTPDIFNRLSGMFSSKLCFSPLILFQTKSITQQKNMALINKSPKDF